VARLILGSARRPGSVLIKTSHALRMRGRIPGPAAGGLAADQAAGSRSGDPAAGDIA
jgi:hypothetical protein